MKKIALLILVFVSLLTSCQYGVFDLLKPNKSIVKLALNGENLPDSAIDEIYNVNLDDNPHDFLILTAYHYKDESLKNFPFVWSSETLNLVQIGNNTNSIGLHITNNLQLGLHTITAHSSVSDNLSKSFRIYVTSRTSSIAATYDISDDFIPIEGVDYTDLLKGEVLPTTEEITLLSKAKYIFKIKNTEDTNVQNYTFSCSNNLNGNGETIVYWTYTNGEFALTIGEDETSESVKPTVQITHNTSGSSLTFVVNIKRIIKTDITEKPDGSNNEKYISLNKNEGEKSFNITLYNSISDSSILYACLPPADDVKRDDSTIITDTSLLWSDKHTFNAYYNADTIPITYFTLSFDGYNRTLTINPILNTVSKDNKNISFYIYLKDEKETYLGKWKIIIGGVIEKIETDKDTLSETVNSAGAINATIYPGNATSSITWYISETPYEAIINGDELIKKAPPPTKDIFLNNLIYMLGEELNGDSKTCTPLMKDNASTLLFSTGNTNGKCYLIALAENTNNEVFKSIPLTINANGEISIRSLTSVYSKATNTNGELVEYDRYSDENGTLMTLPDRKTQEYPYTAENGEYGSTVRTFYFPHNSESSITISMLPPSEGLKWTLLPFKNEILSVSEGKDGATTRFTISPIWFTQTKNALQNTSLTLPPQNKNDTSPDRVAAYRPFLDYLGITYIDLSLDYKQNEPLCRIRIIIYDANVYSQ